MSISIRFWILTLIFKRYIIKASWCSFRIRWLNNWSVFISVCHRFYSFAIFFRTNFVENSLIFLCFTIFFESIKKRCKLLISLWHLYEFFNLINFLLIIMIFFSITNTVVLIFLDFLFLFLMIVIIVDRTLFLKSSFPGWTRRSIIKKPLILMILMFLMILMILILLFCVFNFKSVNIIKLLHTFTVGILLVIL